MRLLVLLAAASLAVPCLHAQPGAAQPGAARPEAQSPTPVRARASVAREIAGPSRHVYTLALPAQTFVSGAVVQHTVDAVVEVFGPVGTRLASFDSPARGPEPFEFTATAAGPYRIEVTPFEGASGRYTFTLPTVEPVATTPERRVAQLFAAQNRPDAPAAVVLVARGDRILLERAFGSAEIAHRVPATTATRINIASASKQFTAFALARMAAEGRLSLDDSVRAFLPELPRFDGPPMTVRHLLTHTSGLREVLNLRLLDGWQGGDRLGPNAALAVARAQTAPQNAPGAEFNYNNTGYMLAALVAERVATQPFAEWMQANVFAPLGMTQTAIQTESGQVFPGAAQGYAYGETGLVAISAFDHAAGATGIVTTARDLSRWLDNLRTRRVGAAALDAITTRQRTTAGDTLGYGLGLFVGRDRGQRVIGHGGAENGSSSYVAYYPDLDARVVVLASIAGFPAEERARAVMDAYFAGRFVAETAPVAAAPGAVAFEPARFDGLAGAYALAPTFTLTFTRDEASGSSEPAKYFVQATGQPRFELFPSSDSTFFLTVVPASATFHRGPDGRAERLTWHQGGQNVPGARVAAYAPPVDSLAAFAGRYVSDEVGVVYTLAVDDSALVVRARRFAEPMRLTPTAPDRFASGGVLGELRFERGAGGAVTAFTLHAGRIRGVRFERTR